MSQNQVTKYIVTTEFFAGNITLIYNETGILLEYAINAIDLKAEWHKYLLEHISQAFKVPWLEHWCRENGYSCRKARIDLSFERFWRMYDNQRDRKRSEELWAKMSNTQRYYVLVNLKAYNRYCLRNEGYSKMAPDTYLRSHYVDNWDRVADFSTRKPNTHADK
ncbi:MAG: hypothetical protein EBZ77_04560 [Chitinophagia bacterium]|nr:hypothetical protein [Chitinophagia bacterium]